MKLLNVVLKTVLKSNIVGLLLVGMSMMMLEACSDNSYVNAIPASATAIVRVSPSELENAHIVKYLHSVFQLDDVAKSGLELSSPFFMFETVDGNFGLCAKVADFDGAANAIYSLADKGKCSKPEKVRGGAIAEVGKSWAIGFSDKSFVVLGPFAEASIQDAQRNILRMLHQSEEQSIVARPMFARLDSIDGAVSMVAQIQALPDKLAAPFSIGVPENAGGTQVLVSASFSLDKGVLRINGETFSFDTSLDSEIKKSLGIYRKIDGRYARRMQNTFPLGIFTNVDGEKFLPLLQQNKAFRTILTGINTALDFDNILRSVDGDIAIIGEMGETTSDVNLNVLAKVKSPTWTADVDYWKQSCPSGTSITGSNNAWTLRSGDTSFMFGVKGDDFYGVTDETLMGKTGSGQSVSLDVARMIIGKRMAMVLNVKPILSKLDMPQGLAKILKSLTDSVSTVVYVMD